MARKSRSARPARAPRSHSRGTERELRGVLIRVNPAGLKALRQLALDQDRTVQSIGIEALNDVLKKHGANPVVANPLREAD